MIRFGSEVCPVPSCLPFSDCFCRRHLDLTACWGSADLDSDRLLWNVCFGMAYAFPVAQSIASFVVLINLRRHNSALQTLDIRFNEIGAAGAAAIGEGLRYDV